MVNISEALDIERILDYSGFDDPAHKNVITADGFDSYDHILVLEDSDIVNPSKGFSYRTVAMEKIIFGLRRTNILKATIHWNQEFRKISQTPSLAVINNAAEFRTAIEAGR